MINVIEFIIYVLILHKQNSQIQTTGLELQIVALFGSPWIRMLS